MYAGQESRPRDRKRSTWNLGEPARGTKGVAASGAWAGGMTQTDFTVTRWYRMEHPGPETPHGLALAHVEGGSGEVSLRTANPFPSLDRLIRIRFSEGRIPHKQANFRVNRGVVDPSNSAQGPALKGRPGGVAVRGGGGLPGHGSGAHP
jgi:hypothetical protein